MEIVILPDGAAVGAAAAARIAAVVQRKPEAVLGLATGSSPLGAYAALADLVARGEVDLSRTSAFALDEYVGVPPESPLSYAATIAHDATGPLGLDPARVRTPDGNAADLEAACSAYEAAIAAAGGVDVQLLGIGANGHIGFNEPTSSFASRTRIKTLAPRTREDNARFFGGDLDAVPMHCITQGLGTILDARQLLLVAQGESKAAAVAAAVEGPLTAMVPGSALQLHRTAVVLLDEAAASKLTLADYYRFTYANKPAWQRVD
ncbi:glucosamine-6-phosphate deaminase [Amnibacterium kyonggiense]|uniref:Glucosamine-6-phosphate deaminase n=1 Tax=Amnibacterium kyonggiense TaxID=595671 RepID=A0A4V3EAP5_9MICO|nr:glucosamine-6-phosphate deaminase [Amnibacterium kyonggiense]TDS77174.1 glucosamine-6-phosphate deaminase [Amnibacterium kyonggiense]